MEREQPMTPISGHVVRRGFTLAELLVVIVIIAIGAALIVPAFGRIVESVNYASAVNTVQGVLTNARDRAVRDGRNTGVAFLFDIKDERYTLLPLELERAGSGSLSRLPGGGSPADRPAHVFRPARNEVAIELPKGTAVFGLSFRIQPVDTKIDEGTDHWYAGWLLDLGGSERQIPWLLPQNDARLYMENDETALANADCGRFFGCDPWAYVINSTGGNTAGSNTAVRHAQSFAVFFTPEGVASDAPERGGSTLLNAYLELPDQPRVRDSTTDEPYDDPTVFDPEAFPSPNRPEPGQPAPTATTGVRNPEVVLRGVAQIAVADLARLREETGIARPWLVRPDADAFDDRPVPAWAEPFADDDLLASLSRWVELNGEVLQFSRYTGDVVRRGDAR